MNLQQHLRERAEASMQDYLENNRVDSESEDDYQAWVQTFVNSEEEWWNIDLTSLNYYDFSSLLTTNMLFSQEYGDTNLPESVNKLMRNYGYYWIEQQIETYMDIWTETIENTQENIQA
jgi:hypothetical protein